MRDSSSTSLDNDGSIVDPHFPRSDAQRLAFLELENRKAIYNLVVSDAEPDAKRAEKIIGCGEHVMVMKNTKTGEYRLGSNWCEHRTCPRCQVAHKMQLAERVATWIGKVRPKKWRFFTFTLRHTDLPLIVQIAFIKACFRKIRQTKIWKASQECGRAFLEVEFNEETGQWHPHLHVIAKGNWIDIKEVQKSWSKATGGSYVVWVDPIKNAAGAGRYVAKYVGKPPAVLNRADSFALLREYYKALRGQQMVITYGNPGPLKDFDPVRENAEEQGDWQPIGFVADFVNRARSGDKEARKLLAALAESSRKRNRPPREKKKKRPRRALGSPA